MTSTPERVRLVGWGLVKYRMNGKQLSKRRKRNPPKLVRRAKPGEKCPACKGDRPGRFYGIYEREVYNTKRPKNTYAADYAAHGRGSSPSPNGNGPQHVIGWCYIKGSRRRTT